MELCRGLASWRVARPVCVNIGKRQVCKDITSVHFSSTSGKYDAVIIGGGPGGYVCAIKCAQLGLRTACVEKRGSLGGTCLNVGCIPSKALLNASHKYHEALHVFPELGIKTTGLDIDFPRMMEGKDSAVSALTQGIEFLFKKNKVDYYIGEGRISDSNTVSVSTDNGNKLLQSDNIVLATGSEISGMPGDVIVADADKIITSDEAIALKEIPNSMAVIGGGVIGVELGSVYARLGCDVTILEYSSQLCPFLDLEVSNNFLKILQGQGLKIRLGTKVTGAHASCNGLLSVTMQDVKTEKNDALECEKILLCVGRKPYTKHVGLEELGVQCDDQGFIETDDHYRVIGAPTVRALGDVTRGPMLAHRAEEDGIKVAELLANCGEPHLHYTTVPTVIYTHPEVAGVGASEEELKNLGIAFKKGKFPFAANSRARTNNDYAGFVKILTDAKTDRILGGWIIGANAGELIAEIVTGMEYGAASEDLGRSPHAHPTLSEAIKEACMAAHGKPIHIA